MGVIIQELSVLYAAFAQGQLSPLAPLSFQYADFARWQRTPFIYLAIQFCDKINGGHAIGSFRLHLGRYKRIFAYLMASVN